MPIRLTPLALFSVFATVAPIPGAAQAPDHVWAPPLPAVTSAATIVVDVGGVDSAVAAFSAYRFLRDLVPELVDSHLDAFARAYSKPESPK